MGIYTLSTWLIFFYIYCFFGWVIESTIVSLKEKRLVNRGFIKGPLLPIYGFGSIIVLFFCLPFKQNILFVYFAGMISATILEYLTGYIMELTLGIRYWDYSNNKFNYKGRICFSSSLFWGLLSVLMTFIIHTPIQGFVTKINNLTPIITLISIYFLIDFIFSLINVLNLSNILKFLSLKKIEMDNLIVQIKQETLSTELKNTLTKRFISIKCDYENKIKNMSFFHRQLIKSYPKVTSKKFNNSIKDIKSKLSSRLQKLKK